MCQKDVSIEQACNPDPVPASRRVAIIPLAPRLLSGSSDLPGGLGRASLDRPPIWPCSVWGLPCPSCHHAGGALLPHLFTLATPVTGSSAVCFLWHFPWGRPRWPLTSTLPVESGLSSPASRRPRRSPDPLYGQSRVSGGPARVKPGPMGAMGREGLSRRTP